MPNHPPPPFQGRILITGATGFLGHNLSPYLARRGYRLRALVRPTSNYAFLEKLGIELAWGDVRDWKAVQAAVEGCQAVIHAAGLFRFWGPYRNFFAINVQGTAHMLEAAYQAGVRRFIHISTIAVVGCPQPGTVITEETPCHPQDAYQHSKLDAEELALLYHEDVGLPVIVLRPGAFYGPWGHYAFNRLFFEDPLKGLAVRIHHGRHLTFPVFVPDLVRVIETTLTQGRLGEVYNVAGKSLTHREINGIISRLMGRRDWYVNVPAGLMLTLARAWTWLSQYTGREPYYPLNLAPYVFCDWNVSSEKAKRELGFRPTPFEEGARQTLAWYAEQGYGPRGLGKIVDWLSRL